MAPHQKVEYIVHDSMIGFKASSVIVARKISCAKRRSPEIAVVLPSGLITRFFELLIRRNFQAAELLLTKINRSIGKGEWNRGYSTALNGILLGLRSGDKKQFINNMADREQFRQEFLRHSQTRMHADFDRGFFAAWSDFCRKR